MTDTRDDAEGRAATWLADWDMTGIHRTGTAGDQAGAEWLMAEAARLGAEPSVEEFTLDRLDPAACYIEFANGERIEGMPVFDALPTGPDGVVGRLASVREAAEIAAAELSPRAVYSGEAERLRRAGSPVGFVVVCTGEMPGLGLLNAEAFQNPYGAPALHLPSEAAPQTRAAIERRERVRLVAYSTRTSAKARNIVLTLPGRERGRTPLVVMTPRSSWWQSTAERGGGIVCWLESLRALLAEPPAIDVIMTANSGHELGHLGLDDFVARRPGCESALSWVHYGANLGAAGGQLQVMSATHDLRALAAAELDRVGQPHALAPKETVPSGETRDIHRAGGRYLTLVGTNPLFHLPQDRWPEAVDLPAVARIAEAAARMVLHLTR